jgi:nicotinamide-nucleotide amidase
VSAVQTAEIIAVGSELLTPHRVDTNSLWLTGRLNDLGIEVRAKAIAGDEHDDLAAIVAAAVSRADLVITTGGLGPTDDDVTRDVVSRVLQRPMHENAEVMAAIEERFKRRGLKMPEINRRQAQVPEGAVVLKNPHGTAPGLWIDHGERVVVLFPGPPRELQPMFEAEVAARLEARSPGRRLRRRVLKVHGRSESQVEEIAYPIYSRLGDDAVPVQTTILATPGQIELHLAAAGADVTAIDRRLDDGINALAAALGSVVFSTDGRSLEQVVGDALRARGWRIAAAESCTGGLLMGRLTDVPGSSAWTIGGVVAYDDEVKRRDLDVPAELLSAHGAVSEPVATAMAMGIRGRFAAEIGVGITGIAGPGGGSAAKPVGLVVIAVVTPSAQMVRTLNFPGDRSAIRQHSTAAALDMVRRALDA